MRNPVFKSKGIKKKATSYEKSGEEIIFRLYGTNIVIIRPHEIELNTGGYGTVITKRRMNQISREFELGYNIFQKDRTWYVDYMGQIVHMGRNIVLNR